MTTPFTIIVNEQELAVTPNQAADLDAISVGANHFHVLKNNTNYQVAVEESDYNNKAYTIKVNGNSYAVKITDKYDRLIKQMGISTTGAAKANNVKSPMPGLVLAILVSEGQEVKKGENLLILEAMKMENVIKAAGDGIIKKITINQGVAVEKGQLLIEID